MSERTTGEVPNDQAPNPPSGHGKGTSGGTERGGRRSGDAPRIGDSEWQQSSPAASSQTDTGSHSEPSVARTDADRDPSLDYHPDRTRGHASNQESNDTDKFTFHVDPVRVVSSNPDWPSGEFHQRNSDDTTTVGDSAEEYEEVEFPFEILGELAANEKDLNLRKQLYSALNHHLEIWHDRQHKYVCQVIQDRHRARVHSLKKIKMMRKIELRAGFGEMIGRLVERIAPVIHSLAEWALPAAMVFLLAKWMTSSYWMKSDEAARSLKELMVMIMAGALGWVARTSVGSSEKKKPSSEAPTD